MECFGERDLSDFADRVGGTEVHRCRRVPSDLGVVLNVVVFFEESGQECAGIIKGGKRWREIAKILQRVELYFGVWVVVGDYRS